MGIEINGTEKKIGLALSGGGFRAAAFHLGVFRKLHELGLLWRLDLLTCVSGGSIAGAFLCANWGDDQVLDRLETYLSTKSIAVSSVIGGLLDPFHTRLDKLAKQYDRDLFHKAKLDSLKQGPRIYFNTTNLATGNLFFFVAGRGEESEMGEHELGRVDASQMSISRAVAASSAFPPVFPPLRVGQDEFESADVDYVTLTDGGVYDNLGVNPLLQPDYNPLDYAIVSDGGKPFELTQEPVESGMAVLKESIGIMMEQVRGLQFKRLLLSHQANQGPKPLWYSIDSSDENNQQQVRDAAYCSNIGTNLKRLSSEEMTRLMRHGGALVHDRLRRYASELLIMA